MYLAQNLNKFARTMSLNAHYMDLFKNPRCQSVCELRETDVSKVDAYKDSSREPYSYLLVDLRPEQDDDLRLRTNILPG